MFSIVFVVASVLVVRVLSSIMGMRGVVVADGGEEIRQMIY